MEVVSREDQMESIQSLQSTISKLANALTQMTESGANTALVKKRLQAASAGLAALDNVWNQTPLPCTPEDLAAACKVLYGLTPVIQNSYVKSKAGSPQRTLLERRIKALERAVQAMEFILAQTHRT
ncbi:hypothetical protein [Paenibacillus tengchongensis]|uniref:hypothetical protein n=1 Tax=Paenibacillus tengchongensis TaxID=2608684 RepID=UPI00124C83BE|nr:hypothetical protein [Paenibacillus tengchongensis]